jgi:hypothetical protein
LRAVTDVKEKLKALEARRAGMDADFNDMRPIFAEIRDIMQPTRGRFNVGEKRRSTTYNKRIIDSAAQKAHRTLVSGLMAGVTSPSRPWFKLGVYDRGAQEDFEVKQWLHVVQMRMYDVIRASNTYRMFSQCYADLGLFGVFGGLMVGDFENIIHTHALPVGLYRLGENGKGQMNALHYSCEKTVGQLVAQFGKEHVSNSTYRAFKANQVHKRVKIHHAIEERRERDPMSALAKDMPMASFYWEDGETDTFLAEGGYGINNILGPRWDQIDNEVWPTQWPALLALGDTVQLQVQHRDKAQAIQYSYKPPMVAAAGFQKRFRNVPGGVTTLDTADLQRGGLRPAIAVRPDVSALMADINETRQRIASAYFEDLFLMTSMSDRRQVTATEIAERHEEKLIVLGPVLESLDYELLSKVIEATFHYMVESDIIPDAPAALVGVPIKVEYVSLLAQAQKAVGVAAIERTLGFAGSLAQLKPEILDNLDGDAMLREFVDQVGPPPNTLAAPADVQSMRQARAQQQQQQQMVDAAEPMANAAKLISEANMRGAEALQKGAPL